jgi:hypothetical protein
MHLTLYNFSKNPLQCVVEWFLTTTTSFYGEDLHLPVMFGVFCWNYSVGGLVMLYMKPQWVSRSQFPYTLFCVLLILVQGMCVLCYLVDVWQGNESLFLRDVSAWSIGFVHSFVRLSCTMIRLPTPLHAVLLCSTLSHISHHHPHPLIHLIIIVYSTTFLSS